MQVECEQSELINQISEGDNSYFSISLSFLQFQYGEDSLEVCKTQYLTKSQLPFLISNNQVLTSSDQITTIKSRLDTEKAPKLLKEVSYTCLVRKLNLKNNCVV